VQKHSQTSFDNAYVKRFTKIIQLGNIYEITNKSV